MDAKAAKDLSMGLKGQLSAVPLGTIVNSILPWSQFAASVNDPGNFDLKLSTWAPCDGRDIQGSKLHIASRSTLDLAPDLRGVFLRGLNTFATDETDPVPKEQRDPDNRKQAGVRQPHNVGGHSHMETAAEPQHLPSADRGDDHIHLWQGGKRTAPRATSDNPAGETRPVNVTVFRYIKIN